MKHEKRIVKTEFAWIFRLFTKCSKWQSKLQIHCYTALFAVILSVAKYPQNLKCEFAFLKRVLNSLDFSLSAKAQNDNAKFLLCANAMRSKWQCLPSITKWQSAFSLSVIASRFHRNGAAIYKFKRKFTFGLPRICTLTLCKFSQWRIPCHTEPLAKYP